MGWPSGGGSPAGGRGPVAAHPASCSKASSRRPARSAGMGRGDAAHAPRRQTRARASARRVRLARGHPGQQPRSVSQQLPPCCLHWRRLRRQYRPRCGRKQIQRHHGGTQLGGTATKRRESSRSGRRSLWRSRRNRGLGFGQAGEALNTLPTTSQFGRLRAGLLPGAETTRSRMQSFKIVFPRPAAVLAACGKPAPARAPCGPFRTVVVASGVAAQSHELRGRGAGAHRIPAGLPGGRQTAAAPSGEPGRQREGGQVLASSTAGPGPGDAWRRPR